LFFVADILFAGLSFAALRLASAFKKAVVNFCLCQIFVFTNFEHLANVILVKFCFYEIFIGNIEHFDICELCRNGGG
jgi:hypothetical protein